MTRPLEGVISQEALTAIGQHVSVITNGLKQGGIQKTAVNREVDQIALIIAAELDVADGNTDRVIHRDTIMRKFSKIAHSPEFGKPLGGISPAKFMEAAEKRLGSIPESISLDAFAQQIARPIHEGLDKAFLLFDRDKNGVVTKEEVSAFMPSVPFKTNTSAAVRGK